MTKDERLERIAELRDANAASEARIAELERKRLEDPFTFDLADARLTGDESDLCFGSAVGEPAGAAPVAKSEPGLGLVYRTQENAQASGAATDHAPSEPDDPWKDWNEWVKAHLRIERQSIREELEGMLVAIIVELREDWREEITKAVAERDTEIAHLRGQVEVLTRLYAGKSDNVAELPKGFIRKVHDNG
jgi:hypothetical protein